MTSQAYQDFDSALKMVDELLAIEDSYGSPLPSSKQKSVAGLRGGASVLMVAAFENFLKSMVEEHLFDMSHVPVKFDLQRVPDVMRLNNIEQVIRKIEIDGKNKDRLTKINLYAIASQVITEGNIISDGFSKTTRGNPAPDRIKELFSSVGVSDFFRTVKNDFENEWKSSVAHTFIEDTLAHIVNRRHQVAHTASVLSIARADLDEALKFLRVFALICDRTLENHISQFF